MGRSVTQLAASAFLFACAPRIAATPPTVDERALRWGEWARRVEALPGCLQPELQTAPLEPPSFSVGDTVDVRGQLGLLELDCSGVINELVLRGRWLPAPGAVLSLREIDDAVARAGRTTCGSVLGVRVGTIEFAIEPPLPVRVWRENDAELFDALLAQTDAVVTGVVEAGSGRQAVLEPSRACRAPGPPLELRRLPDDGVRWKLFDGLEVLSNLPAVSATRRAQGVLSDVAAPSDPPRARRAAERLITEFGDHSRSGRQPK
jgi:hypothetical protein